MLNDKFINEVLEVMHRKLINDDLQSRAEALLDAVNLIKSASYTFKQAGLKSQSDNLNNILEVIGNTLSSKTNYSFKQVIASIEEDLNFIKIENGDLLNLDLGDINLSNDELLDLEGALLNEVEQEELDDITFEDELN